MKDLIRAELLKVRTTRMAAWMALAMAGSVLLALAVSITTAGSQGLAPLESSEGLRNVLAASASGSSLVLILGVLSMAGEFRHNTATSTFLVTPERGRVVGAKLAAAALVGLAFAVGAALLTLLVALPWLAIKGVDASALSGDVGVVLAGAIAATMLAGVIGVGVGALIRHQTVAVIVALIWMMVVETLVVALLPSVGRWLPGGAVSALTHTATPNGDLLPMWGGGLLLTAYGLAFAYAGTRLTVARDIT